MACGAYAAERSGIHPVRRVLNEPRQFAEYYFGDCHPRT